jgi:alcohol dehydrogenase class IV
MKKLGNIAALTDILQSTHTGFSIYDKVDTEPTDIIVYEGADRYRLERCDFLIGIGGGSPIDAMKAIGAVVATGERLADMFGREINGSLPPMAAIPTTAGTGSEATKFTIITDGETHVKMLLRGACLLPDLAIIDPAFTISAPAPLTAFTGLDALCHAAEAYTSIKAQPMSDIFALSAAKRIFAHLEKSFDEPGNIESRAQMSLAATEAGIAFGNSSVTVIHGMSRPIGAEFGVPHGLSNAMLMERCFNYIYDGVYAKLAEIARHCGLSADGSTDHEAAGALMAKISGMVSYFRIPTLRAYDVNREDFKEKIPKMASDAIKSGSPANTRMELSYGDIASIYNSLI